jgi:arylsulfatase A-like enzyme
LDEIESVSMEVRRELEALYDAEIAANDENFGLLLDKLQKLGIYDSSVVVFVSDHGEEFYEHRGWTHGKTLHAEMLRVPLVIKMPGAKNPRRLSELAQHVDLFPTLVELAGGTVPTMVQGRSLVSLLVPDHVAQAGTMFRQSFAHLDLRGKRALSVVEGEWKAIQRFESEDAAFPSLYSVELDPGELANKASILPTRAKTMMATYRRILKQLAHSQMEAPAIDESELERVSEELRALGYIK